MSSGIHVADATDPFRVLQRVSHDAFVGRVHVVFPLNTAVTADAILSVVDRHQELAVDEYLLPCLQRRQLPRSALAGGFLRLDLLFLYSQILQACLVSVAGYAVTGADLCWWQFSHWLGR
jgi:hypothetical protein